MYVHEVLVNRLGGLSLPRKSVVMLTDRPDMALDVYRGRKTTMQQQQQQLYRPSLSLIWFGPFLPYKYCYSVTNSWLIKHCTSGSPDATRQAPLPTA